MPPSEFLKRRNALWQRLRALAEDRSPEQMEFGAILTELCELTGWERERVLAGLGLSAADLSAHQDRP